jgi:hypothetical protein
VKHKLFFAVGVVLFVIASVASIPAMAQTVAPGPYYATPSWDQKLQCDTQATCPRFIVLSNWDSAVVLDRETGLVWERSPSTSTFTWAGAQNHCNQLAVSNRVGWRLPTLQELASLVDRSQLSPALPPGHPFSNNVRSSAYWSATTLATLTGFAWGVSFDIGDMVAFDKSFTLHVWCVRGGQGVDPQ